MANLLQIAYQMIIFPKNIFSILIVKFFLQKIQKIFIFGKIIKHMKKE